MAPSMAQGRTGLVNSNTQSTPKLSTTAILTMATWNCGGLSKIKLDLCKDLDLDVLCLTETHSWREGDSLTINSDLPPPNDSWSGVALVLNKRLSGYIINTGSIGSRITFCRLRGTVCNIMLVSVYIPQKLSTNPNQKDTYKQLDSFLSTIGRRDCVVLMGDFNSRLARNTTNRVGKWCIHNRMDTGGKQLLKLMDKLTLRCVSSYFQPRRRHNNATYQNIQPEKAPSQIDYVLVSSRWSTAIRDCKVKWGLPIKAYGRKYDHAILQFKFQLHLKKDRRSKRVDFRQLSQPNVAQLHRNAITAKLGESDRPHSTTEQYKRLNKALINAQKSIPTASKKSTRKWETSSTTSALLTKRSDQWSSMDQEQRNNINKAISRSARADYRQYVDNVLTDMESAEKAGKTDVVFKIAKQLSTKRNGNQHTQPALDDNGNPITSTKQQLNLWADFLDKKFAPGVNEPEIDLSDPPEAEPSPPITMAEVKECVKKLKSGKAPGPDTIPVEQYKASPEATAELHELISSIHDTESLPDEFAFGDILLFYKKKSKDDRKNYRVLGLLNHAYKIFAMIILLRILPYITPLLSDMQAGFRKNRGCRDNITILVTVINHLLKTAEQEVSQCVMTYIDFTAAFDSIKHSYLISALKEYNVPLKYCRLVKLIYDSAAMRVRIQEVGGKKSYSRNINIRRGVIQGDIPSPVCFLVALDKLLKDHGQLDKGILISTNLSISELDYADDCALPSPNSTTASERLTNLDTNAQREAGMVISIPKTKAQHIMKQPKMPDTTEVDVQNLPEDKQFKFRCEFCDMTYPTKHGLAVHQGRWCKKRKTSKKPSRKGTVADRIIKRMKTEVHQATLPKVHINNSELENVYSFTYLGADIPADGNPEVAVQHRTNIAWGRFGEYRTTLLSTKLPRSTRVRLYRTLIGQTTMIYGCEAWSFTEKIKKKINGVNSKMLSQITKRTIHQEAASPTFNIVGYIRKQRWSYLGHIIRLDPNRALRKFVIDLAPEEAPFTEGSLTADSHFSTKEELINAANNRVEWQRLAKQLE